MTRAISIKINGVDRKLEIKDNELLLDAIRDKAGVKSVKAGCWRGECGLCTVLLDGKPVKSCLVSRSGSRWQRHHNSRGAGT